MTKHIHKIMHLYQGGSPVFNIPLLAETEDVECGIIEDGVCSGCGRELEAPEWAEATITQEIDERMSVRALDCDEPIGFQTLEEAKKHWEAHHDPQ